MLIIYGGYITRLISIFLVMKLLIIIYKLGPVYISADASRNSIRKLHT